MKKAIVMMSALVLFAGLMLPIATAEVTHAPGTAIINWDEEATDFEVTIDVDITEDAEAGEYQITLTNPDEHAGLSWNDTILSKEVTKNAQKVFRFYGVANESVEEGTYTFTYEIIGPNNYTDSGELEVTVRKLELPCFDAIYMPAIGLTLLGAVFVVRKW